MRKARILRVVLGACGAYLLGVSSAAQAIEPTVDVDYSGTARTAFLTIEYPTRPAKNCTRIAIIGGVSCSGVLQNSKTLMTIKRANVAATASNFKPRFKKSYTAFATGLVGVGLCADDVEPILTVQVDTTCGGVKESAANASFATCTDDVTSQSGTSFLSQLSTKIRASIND